MLQKTCNARYARYIIGRITNTIATQKVIRTDQTQKRKCLKEIIFFGQKL